MRELRKTCHKNERSDSCRTFSTATSLRMLPQAQTRMPLAAHQLPRRLRLHLARRVNDPWNIFCPWMISVLWVKPRSGPLSAEQRLHMASQKVRLGEITRARQCLTGAPLAPGNDDTLNELQRKRPQEIVKELPEHVRAFVP